MNSKKKHSNKDRLWQKILILLLSLVFFGGGSSFLWAANLKLPDIKVFSERKISESTKIYDRTEKILLYDIHENIKRTVVPSGDISRNVKNATVAIEDSEFYEHKGIRIIAILRAVLANLGAGSYSQGGSTITQQVVKNSLLTAEKTVSRKLKEWILSLKLEKKLTKDEILTIYLNEIPYGGNLYGIEEASFAYLKKKSSELTIAESAYLAAMSNAPTYYSPYGNNKDKLENRKNLVLKKMLEKSFISQNEYEKALEEKVIFEPQEDYGIKAPHFVIYVKQFLENKYGREAVEEKGLKVITTLDYELEKKAEEIAQRYALENKTNFNAENVSIVAIDPTNGDILTMVGSRNYFDKEIDGNFNVAIAKRQPGSAFKPFVYATAFKKGFTPETVVFDLQTEFSTECNPDGAPIILGNEDKCYKPVNYDQIFRGPITLRNALAQSINIPAIKTLYLAGLNDSLQTAKDVGIGTLGNADLYGLTLVLGGGEVTLLDMTSSYGVLGNNGKRNPSRAILRVEDKDGNVIESFEPKPNQVISEQISLQISDILNDNEARTPAFGQNSPLYFPGRDVAVKTGTTNDYHDAWIIGYTPQISVGAWAGNNDNSPMEKKVARFIVAPMWREFMNEVLKNFPAEKFKRPPAIDKTSLKPVLKGFWQGGKTYFVDKISGKLATEYTPPELKEERVVREIHSILYWIDKSNLNGPKPENPGIDPQFKLWEYAVLKWAAENKITNETDSVIPKEEDPLHRPEFAPKVSITNISSEITYKRGEKMEVLVLATGKFPISKIEFFVNDRYIGSSTRQPFSFTFFPEDIDNIRQTQTNSLRAVGYDVMQNRGETATIFKIAL